MNDPICEKLASLTILRDFQPDEVEALAELAERQTVAPGEVIVRQDEHGDTMYLLVMGEAVVNHRKDGHTFELARLREGDFFGEIALVDEGPRSADVVAETECVLFGISQGTVRALAGVYPGAAFKFLLAVGRVLVERMRAGNRKYIDSLMVEKRAE